MNEGTLQAYSSMVKVLAQAIYSDMIHEYKSQRAQNWDEPHGNEDITANIPLNELVFYDIGNSDRTWLTDVLRPLGIVTFLQDEDGTFHHRAHRLLCPPSEVPQLVRAQWPQGIPFEKLLREFFLYHIDYGQYGLEFLMNVVFHPKNGMEDVVTSLVRLRYTERHQDGFRWTKKMRWLVRAAVRSESYSAIQRAYTVARFQMGDFGLFPGPHRTRDDE